MATAEVATTHLVNSSKFSGNSSKGAAGGKEGADRPTTQQTSKHKQANTKIGRTQHNMPGPPYLYTNRKYQERIFPKLLANPETKTLESN